MPGTIQGAKEIVIYTFTSFFNSFHKHWNGLIRALVLLIEEEKNNEPYCSICITSCHITFYRTSPKCTLPQSIFILKKVHIVCTYKLL